MTIAYEWGEPPKIEVRHRLRIAREHAGLDQTELAEMIGVARNTITNAENGMGKRGPRKILINAIALATAVPASWIMTGESPPQTSPEPGEGLLLPRVDSNHEPADCLFAERHAAA